MKTYSSITVIKHSIGHILSIAGLSAILSAGLSINSYAGLSISSYAVPLGPASAVVLRGTSTIKPTLRALYLVINRSVTQALVTLIGL